MESSVETVIENTLSYRFADCIDSLLGERHSESAVINFSYDSDVPAPLIDKDKQGLSIILMTTFLRNVHHATRKAVRLRLFKAFCTWKHVQPQRRSLVDLIKTMRFWMKKKAHCLAASALQQWHWTVKQQRSVAQCKAVRAATAMEYVAKLEELAIQKSYLEKAAVRKNLESLRLKQAVEDDHTLEETSNLREELSKLREENGRLSLQHRARELRLVRYFQGLSAIAGEFLRPALRQST